MTDKAMKDLLKNAYKISETDREKVFLKKYEKRSMHIFDVFRLEFKYMSVRSMVSGMMLVLFFALISFSKNPELIWYISGLLPVAGLILISGLGKSERYGMQELEAASRFSLRFIKAVRMFIMGCATLFIVIATSIVMQEKTGFNFITILGLIGTPYMLNAWGNLIVTRRWHEKENIYGCLLVALVTCMLPALMEKAISYELIQPFILIILLLVVSALTVRESLLYIKEREDLSWNLN